jgi:HSP20 family protein
MARHKRSFFERLTGSSDAHEYDDDFEVEKLEPSRRGSVKPALHTESARPEYLEEEGGDGQLSVDVFQTADEIVIRAHAAGVRPDDLDVSITRDMITIKGKREEAREVADDNYFFKELYWGTFSRTILLPQEIDVESAQASEKHGLLTLRLPKIDKGRQTKLKVRTS